MAHKSSHTSPDRSTHRMASQRATPPGRQPGTSTDGAPVAVAFSAGERDAIMALEAALGHTFTSRQLLLDALTHRSYAYEFAGPGVISNERLEFLGDAALALICSHLLY
ncbi:MAG: hypothetical protein ABI068_11665, partial [Ktedonobacterales bacterium]